MVSRVLQSILLPSHGVCNWRDANWDLVILLFSEEIDIQLKDL